MNEEEKKLLLEWEMILRNITDFVEMMAKYLPNPVKYHHRR